MEFNQCYVWMILIINHMFYIIKIKKTQKKNVFTIWILQKYLWLYSQYILIINDQQIDSNSI